jgi:hypothetical protein
MQHPRHKELGVQWYVGHPKYEDTSGEFVLGEFLANDPKTVREGLRKIRLPSSKEHVLERLFRRVDFQVDDELLVDVLEKLKLQYGIPVTIHREELPALNPQVTMSVQDALLRDVFQQLVETAGTTCKITGGECTNTEATDRIRRKIQYSRRRTGCEVIYSGHRWTGGDWVCRGSGEEVDTTEKRVNGGSQ